VSQSIPVRDVTGSTLEDLLLSAKEVLFRWVKDAEQDEWGNAANTAIDQITRAVAPTETNHILRILVANPTLACRGAIWYEHKGMPTVHDLARVVIYEYIAEMLWAEYHKAVEERIL